MCQENIVNSFFDFQLQVRTVEDTDQTFDIECGSADIFPYHSQLKRNCLSLNAEFAMIACAYNLSHICDHLGSDYMFSVTPTGESDHQRDKKSVFTILRVRKRRTVLVVIELKFSISTQINCLAKELAQLLLEVQYVSMAEQSQQQSMLCVLGDDVTWHFFVVDIARTPFRVLYYVLIHNKPLEKVCYFIQRKIEEYCT